MEYVLSKEQLVELVTSCKNKEELEKELRKTYQGNKLSNTSIQLTTQAKTGRDLVSVKGFVAVKDSLIGNNIIVPSKALSLSDKGTQYRRELKEQLQDNSGENKRRKLNLHIRNIVVKVGTLGYTNCTISQAQDIIKILNATKR